MIMTMPFSFHPLGKLQTAFQGYQGVKPADSRIIFLGKDANFPEIDPNSEAEKLRRVCNFLAGREWKTDAVFRRSLYYEDRNTYPERAHHPFLLKCFPGNRAGAPYHGKIARLIDEMYSCLHEQGRADLAKNLVGKHLSFVELIRCATTGNNGEYLDQVFRGNLPCCAKHDPLGFPDKQKSHREETLRTWLLSSSSAKKPRTVVIPMSIFNCLCRPEINEAAKWLRLTPDHGTSARKFFGCGGKHSIYPLPDFDGRDWLITNGFPYFRGRKADEIKQSLRELAEALSQRLLGSSNRASK